MKREKIGLICLSLIVIVFLLFVSFLGCEAGAAEAIQLADIRVANQPIEDLENLTLTLDDLTTQKIEEKKVKTISIKGKAVSKSGKISEIELSLDGGKHWSKASGRESWEFSFSPTDRTNYSLIVKATDDKRNIFQTDPFQITYQEIKTEDFIKEYLKKLETLYEEEDLQEVLAYFSKEAYPDYDSLEGKIEDTFDDNSDIGLDLSKIDVNVSGNRATVKVDWYRTWDTSSSDSGTDVTVKMVRKGNWQVVDVDNESLFAIGTGTVSGSVTDR